jgi:hypothetical protein
MAQASRALRCGPDQNRAQPPAEIVDIETIELCAARLIAAPATRFQATGSTRGAWCRRETIVGVDVNESRLALARELGATHTVNAAEELAVDAVRSVTGGGADFSLAVKAALRMNQRKE